MPAKKLTPEQKADAGRLLLAFKAWQKVASDKKLPSTQAEAAYQLGFNQSSMSQYLTGKIPLNPPVLAKFAELFEVDPASISKDVVARATESAAPWVGIPTPKTPTNIASRRGPLSSSLTKRIGALNPEQLAGLEQVIEGYLRAILPVQSRKRKRA